MANERFRVEPLGTQRDRAAFSCGVEPLDRYLHQQASQDVRRNLAKVFVMVDLGSRAVAGYYTLSATSIQPAALPPEIKRKLARYADFPAVLIGRLALDQHYQGQGLGEVLLFDALRRVLRTAAEIGTLCLVVDAKNPAARGCYEAYGFQQSGDDEFRLFLPLATAAKSLPDHP